MSLYFEELDYRLTPIGALSLRRRRELSLGVDVFEIKLGDEYLMSSLFTASEIALARLGLAELSGPGLDVVVGGLGLGYTAQAVLQNEAVKYVLVVEAMDAVINWHETGLLPLGPVLTKDPRCRLVLGDFFCAGGFERRIRSGRAGATIRRHSGRHRSFSECAAQFTEYCLLPARGAEKACLPPSPRWHLRALV